MKRKLLTYISLALCLVLLSSLIGCGSNTGSTASSTSVATSISAPADTAAAASTTSPAATPEKAPVTLRFFYNDPGANQQLTPGIQTDPVAQEIEKVTGVKMDFYKKCSPGDDAWNVAVASGDLPDILFASKKVVPTLLSAKSTIALDDLIASNAPNLQKQTAILDFSKSDVLSNDGKIHFLTRNPNSISFWPIGPMLRWDWYQEMGSPAINNVDDYIKVVADMVKAHPTTADGKKVYGFSPWFDGDWATWAWSVPGFGAVGSQVNDTIQENMADSTLTYSYLDEKGPLWWTVETYYKIKKAGILDPEAFTQKFDTAAQKAADLRVLGGFVDFPFVNANKTLAANGEAKGYMMVPPAKGTKASQQGMVEPLGSDSMLAVSSSCKTPDRAMDLLNYLYSEEGTMTILDGIKGKDWDIVNGQAKENEDVVKAFKTNASFTLDTGIQKYMNLYGLGWIDGRNLNLLQDREAVQAQQLPIEKKYFSELGAKDYQDLFQQRIDNIYANSAQILLAPISSDDVKRTDADIKSYFLTNAPRAVLAKDDADFQNIKKSIIDGIKKINGFDASYSFWNDAFVKEKAFMDKNNLWAAPKAK